jgi:CheY-like chemotaxis protein
MAYRLNPTYPMTAPLVLVIDDSDATRHAYAELLRLEGFAVEEARDGQEGLAKAIEFLPAIIITDVAMPIMDGWETMRRLRADERTRASQSSPAAAWTARRSRPNRRRMRCCGSRFRQRAPARSSGSAAPRRRLSFTRRRAAVRSSG